MGRDRTRFDSNLNRHQFSEHTKGQTGLSGHMLGERSQKLSNAVFEHGAAAHQQRMFTGEHGVQNAILYTLGHPKTLQGRFRSTTPNWHQYNRPVFNEGPAQKGKKG